ncbi:MAG: serine/threonine-protein kinase [Acidobacteria bacterium]|nr:serine/threonine-protein kinase [Acidobacteriota bacterium]
MKPERWQQIEKVYTAALQREPSERAAFLDEACAGDEEMRREVESLLAYQGKAEGFIEAPALEVAAKCLADRQPGSVVGRSLGPYKILAPLGVGGMGEVYRASDTKLGRDVAVKVLPKAFAQDPERLARFEREAHLLASLNHPNIAVIHGLEESDGVRYLVLELVPGETLAERLAAGPLPVQEPLRICVQIAEALEAAHEKGIIHRDLKPANIKVTPEGKVKVLDFGLGKAFAGTGTDLSQLPTITVAGTREGVILGTVAYMSPEQARGKPVDKRTDIWSFGCVAYELLTGRSAFAGETTSDTIAAILERDPDWQALPISTPPKVRDLLGRCLQKDAHRRLRDMGDARIEMEDALTAPATAEPAVAAIGGGKGWRRTLLWGLFGLAVGAIVASIAVWNLKPLPPPAPRPMARLILALSPAERLAGLDRPAVALSPDGTHLVYVGSRGDSEQLYLRSMDEPEGKPIPGTEGALNPFFSPDGRWVGFFAANKLKKVSTSGGAPVILA